MDAAIKKRTAAPRNGGMLSSPILIANHVDPQRMQIRMYPRTTFVDSDFSLLFLYFTKADSLQTPKQVSDKNTSIFAALCDRLRQRFSPDRSGSGS